MTPSGCIAAQSSIFKWLRKQSVASASLSSQLCLFVYLFIYVRSGAMADKGATRRGSGGWVYFLNFTLFFFFFFGNLSLLLDILSYPAIQFYVITSKGFYRYAVRFIYPRYHGIVGFYIVFICSFYGLIMRGWGRN